MQSLTCVAHRLAVPVMLAGCVLIAGCAATGAASTPAARQSPPEPAVFARTISPEPEQGQIPVARYGRYTLVEMVPEPAVPHSGCVPRRCAPRCPAPSADRGSGSRCPAAPASVAGSAPTLRGAGPNRAPGARPARRRCCSAPGPERCARKRRAPTAPRPCLRQQRGRRPSRSQRASYPAPTAARCAGPGRPRETRRRVPRSPANAKRPRHRLRAAAKRPAPTRPWVPSPTGSARRRAAPRPRR